MERKLKKNDGEEEKEGQVNEDTDVESIYIKWRCGRTERMGVSGHLDAGMFLGVAVVRRRRKEFTGLALGWKND